MSTASTIRRMLAAGLTIEQALTAVEAIEAELEESIRDRADRKRVNGAARQRAYMARKKASASNDSDDANDSADASSASDDVISVSNKLPRAGIYNHARADGNLNPLTTFGDISSPSSNELSPLRPEAARSARCELFERFWNAYPRRIGRKAALAKFQTAVRSGVDAEQLIAAAARFAEAHRLARTDQKYIPHPATWLNHGRYEDEELPAPFTPAARAGPAIRDNRNGVGYLLAEAYGIGSENGREETNYPENVRALPLTGDGERRADGGDDSGVSRNAVELLVANSIRRV